MRITTPLLAATLTLLLPAPSAAAQTATDPALQEWEVPYSQSRPRDPMVAPDGRVWFVGQVGNYVSVLDPKTGSFEKFDMDEGVNPHNLIVDADGTVYYSGNRASHIGRLDPETGDVEKFMMPDERARDPHTLIFDSMGDVWFTAQNGNFVGKLWTETGEVRLLETPLAPGRGGRIVRRGGQLLLTRPGRDEEITLELLRGWKK